MKEITLEEEMTKIEKVLIKNGMEGFVQAMRSSDPDALEQKLTSLAKHREEIRNTRAKDTELERVVELKKELDAPYREQLRMNEKMTRFVYLLMGESE